MKTIGSMKELSELNSDLVKSIVSSCPWMTAELRQPEIIDYVFVLDNSEINKLIFICTVMFPTYRIVRQWRSTWNPSIFGKCQLSMIRQASTGMWG